MSTTTDTPPRQTRRERRAAERANAAPARRAAARSSQRRFSPILLITLVVGAVGVALVGGLILTQGGSPSGTDAALIAPAVPTPVELASERSLGKADAPVTLDLWTDFQCPVCGDLARTVEPGLITKYVTPGILRIVHHDAAFQGAKSTASFDELVEPAAGARCAADQGRYWPFQDYVFANQNGENQGAFAAGRLKAMAGAAGLDVAAWETCVASGAQQAAVRAETSKAQADGVAATPTMHVNGEVVVGMRSVSQLGVLIEAAAAKAGK